MNTTDPDDYVGFASQNLVFQAEFVQCVDIPIVNDTEFEGLETFIFQISPAQSDRAVLVMPSLSTAAVSISDPEDGMF